MTRTKPRPRFLPNRAEFTTLRPGPKPWARVLSRAPTGPRQRAALAAVRAGLRPRLERPLSALYTGLAAQARA